MAVLPLQIADGVGTVIVGVGFTVTVTVVLPEHPLKLIPVIVYVVVTKGLAVTIDPDVALNPVDGVQV